MTVLCSDFGYFDFSIKLAMTLLLFLVFLGLVSDYVDFFALTLLDDLGLYADAINIRRAYLEAVIVGKRKNLVELNKRFRVAVYLFDKNNVALADLVLLSACFKYREHEKHLSFCMP